jgi:HSP20 family molecular chaperone IbpA
VATKETDTKTTPAKGGRELAPWLADWLDVPELSRWFETRPALFGAGDRMRIEEEHRDGEIVVRAELPGVDPEKDVDITIENGMLRIRAERRKEEREESEGRTRSEFRYGMLSRTISLPSDVDPDAISASYRDGILEVHIPATKQAESRKINVNRG